MPPGGGIQTLGKTSGKEQSSAERAGISHET